MNRFRRDGAATPLPIAGYIKPEGAKSFHDWYLDESRKEEANDGAKLLRETLNCSLVADHFNSIGFPVGPYFRKTEWDGAMVRSYFKNPILKGKPERGNMHSVKHHESGRRRSEKNPDGPLAIHMPHLEMIPELLFDELNALLDEQNCGRGRKSKANGQDPLEGVPRKRTRFPGQHAKCWYCGRIMVWGGNGIKDHLQCSGSRNWRCWNSIGVSGPRVCELVVQKTTKLLYDLDGFEDLFSRLAKTVNLQPRGIATLQDIEREEAALAKEERNLMETIRKFGAYDSLDNELEKIKAEKLRIAAKRNRTELARNRCPDFPSNVDELRDKIQDNFLKLAKNSYEFGTMIPKIVPELYVFLVRMYDGGPLLPRVRFTVDLTSAFTANLNSKELQRMLRKSWTCDVFDLPKRELIREEVISLSKEGRSRKDIAAEMDTPTSVRVVGDAISLNRMMTSQNIVDPLLVQMEPPTDLKKLRRHKHERYSFEMAEGYVQPPILD